MGFVSVLFVICANCSTHLLSAGKKGNYPCLLLGLPPSLSVSAELVLTEEGLFNLLDSALHVKSDPRVCSREGQNIQSFWHMYHDCVHSDHGLYSLSQ